MLLQWLAETSLYHVCRLVDVRLAKLQPVKLAPEAAEIVRSQKAQRLRKQP